MRAKISILAGVAALASVVAAHAPGQEAERCYGVALAGANDGVGDAAAPGSSTADYQGDAWTLTPRGTCLTMPLPPQPDGTPRRGSLEPLARDPAK